MGLGGVGVAEEEEVGNVEVELGEEWGDEVVPLPHGIGAEAMDEKEGGFNWVQGFRNPGVDDGAVAEVGGS